MIATVVSGRGEAARFTALDWVGEGCRQAAGIVPHPGTLNLRPRSAADAAAWADLRDRPGVALPPPDATWCAARLHRVRVQGRVPAVIVVPLVPGYPPDQIELIAGVGLREVLSLADGDAVALEVSEPLTVSAVLFDMDGTLVDSLAAFRVVAETAAAPHGLEVTEATVRAALNHGHSFWEGLVPQDRVGRDVFIKALASDAARHWPAILAEHGRVLPDVVPVLDTLQAAGAKLGIVTGARRWSLEPLRTAGLLERFDAVVTRDDLQRGKPDPEGLRLCSERLGVAPSGCVYVGDTPLDVHAARAAGMPVISVLTGAGDCPLLTSCGPDFLSADLMGTVPILRIS